jgi:hypothetical protein
MYSMLHPTDNPLSEVSLKATKHGLQHEKFNFLWHKVRIYKIEKRREEAPTFEF